MAKLFKKAIPLIIIFTAALVFRLPQLSSKYFILDGDEAIVGLMSKHLLEGKEFPLYFYGQSYGLSIIEAGLGAFGFALLGVSDLALKLAMLFLWSLGCFFYFKAIRTHNSLSLSILWVSVLILIPAWLVWSMKARGGYLTSFAAAGACYYLLQTKGPAARYLLIGYLLGLIFEAQPLWLPGLTPLVCFWLYKQKSWKPSLYCAVGVASFFASLKLLPNNGADFWKPPVFGSFNIDTLTRLPEQIIQSFGGFYYIDETWPIPLASKLLAYLLFSALVACLIHACVSFFKTRRLTIQSALALSVLASISYAPFIPFLTPRYLLPLSVPVLLLLLQSLSVLRQKMALGILSVFMLLGVFACLEARTYKLSDYYVDSTEGEQLNELIDALKQQGIEHVFSRGALMQWQLMFYANEEVIARYRHPTDRYPSYVEQVNKAYLGGKPTALVGHHGDFDELVDTAAASSPCFIRVNPQYDIYLCPDSTAFKKYGISF